MVGFDSDEDVITIRDALRTIESQAGRQRGPKKFESRILDIDILLYGDLDLRPRDLNIPRDEIERYAYVLKPLADLYPQAVHPVTGENYLTMWRDYLARHGRPGDAELRKTDFDPG